MASAPSWLADGALHADAGDLARHPRHNRGKPAGLADGIVITPSHNPPEDGGFKYNPPHGGPADTDVTRWIEDRANALLAAACASSRGAVRASRRADGVRVAGLHRALRRRSGRHRRSPGHRRGASVKIGVDPLGGASVAYWAPIAERYGLDSPS